MTPSPAVNPGLGRFRFRRAAAALALSIATLLSGAAATPTSASASEAGTMPSGCVGVMTPLLAPGRGLATCVFGPGSVRALLGCSTESAGEIVTHAYGNWVPAGAGSFSVATCPTSVPYAVFVHYFTKAG
jgi:hypothetical protein